VNGKPEDGKLLTYNFSATIVFGTQQLVATPGSPISISKPGHLLVEPIFIIIIDTSRPVSLRSGAEGGYPLCATC
jgi:hypothetical protein